MKTDVVSREKAGQRSVDGKYFLPYFAVYVILRRGSEVLLQLRKGGYGDGLYSFVSGHVDQDEPATKALIREVKEEVNITLEEKDLRFIHASHTDKEDRTYIRLYFEAVAWKGDLKNLEPEKCGGLRWCDLENLPENIIADVQEGLKGFQGVLYDEVGW